MDSNEIEIEGMANLKYLWLSKKIVVRILLLLSNVYDFAKENVGDFKTTVVSVENTLVSHFGPGYEKLKVLAEQIILFVDDKFDKHAPSLAKKLVVKFQSIIYKTKPLIKILITTTQTIVVPLITITIFLFQTTKYLIQNITTTTITKSALLVGKTQTPIQKSLDTTKSLVSNTVLQEGPKLANQAQDITKSLFGGIPLMGNVAESLETNPTNLANQIVNKTNSLVNVNPVLEAVNSAAKSSLDIAESLGPDTILQKNPELATNPIELANQILNTTNSLVNENPLLGMVNSTAQNIGNKPQATGMKAVLQSAYVTLKLAGIPVIAQLWYEIVKEYPLVGEVSEFILPVVECVCELYNKVVNYMDGNNYSISGYLPLLPIDEMKAAYKLVKTSRDGLSTVGDLLGMNNKGLSTVGDLFGMKKNN